MRTRQLGHETIVATTFSRQATRHNFKNIKKNIGRVHKNEIG